MKQLSLIFVTLCTLIACAPKAPPLVEDKNAAIKLAESADSVSNALIELARIEAASKPQHRKHRLVSASTYGMQGVATVDWAGPIEPLVKNLAKATKYHVRILGSRPAVPVIVSLYAKDKSLATLLRDVDYKAGNRANIKVFPRQRVIELRYARI